MVTAANAGFRRVDIPVNDAGGMLLGLIGGADTDEWRQVMKAQASGYIASAFSVAGRTASVGASVYNASK